MPSSVAPFQYSCWRGPGTFETTVLKAETPVLAGEVVDATFLSCGALRQFFERDFKAQKTFGQTKEQIRYRLNAILENPTLERLFTSADTIAGDVQSGAVRFSLFRVDRLSWAAGKLVGQTCLMAMGVTA